MPWPFFVGCCPVHAVILPKIHLAHVYPWLLLDTLVHAIEGSPILRTPDVPNVPAVDLDDHLCIPVAHDLRDPFHSSLEIKLGMP